MDITVKHTFDISDIIINLSIDKQKDILMLLLEDDQKLQDYAIDIIGLKERAKEMVQDEVYSEYDEEIEKAQNRIISKFLKFEIIIHPDQISILEKFKSQHKLRYKIKHVYGSKYIVQVEFNELNEMFEYVMSANFTKFERNSYKYDYNKLITYKN